MGYYTDFELKAVDTPWTQDMTTKWENITGYNIDGMYSIKWYDWGPDMITFSKHFPGIIFQLDGKGEDPDDVWRHYFHNGNDHAATISYTPPDKVKLGIAAAPMKTFKV